MIKKRQTKKQKKRHSHRRTKRKAEFFESRIASRNVCSCQPMTLFLLFTLRYIILCIFSFIFIFISVHEFTRAENVPFSQLIWALEANHSTKLKVLEVAVSAERTAAEQATRETRENAEKKKLKRIKSFVVKLSRNWPEYATFHFCTCTREKCVVTRSQ